MPGENPGRSRPPAAEFLGLAVLLGAHRNERKQPQGLDVPRIPHEDFTVDLLGFFQSAGALMRRSLRDQLARRIGAQKGLHQLVRLIATAGLGQRVHQRQLGRLEFRIELERLAQLPDRLVEAALLQEAAAELFKALGITRLFRQRSAQQRLGFLAAALAIQRRTEQRHQVRLAREFSQGVTA